MTRHSPNFPVTCAHRISRLFLVRVALTCFLYVALGATAFAESDRWTKCRGGDSATRIVACTQIIDRANHETKRDQIAAYLNRGAAYLAKGEFDRAIVDYGSVLRLDRRSAAAHSGRAQAYRSKGDLDKALADLDEALRLDPKSAQILIDRGDAYAAKGDFGRAIADFNDAIEHSPASANAYDKRGLAFSGKHDFDHALADFSKAIEFDSKFAGALLDRAGVYRAKQDLEHAKLGLEAALRLDPNLSSAKESLDEVNSLIAKSVASSAAAAPLVAPPISPGEPATPRSFATPDRLFVVAIGLGLIAFIVWFFWLKRTTGVRAAGTSGGYQEAMILVKGGYTPDTIIVRQGKPVRLNFRREETASCSDKVIFADFQKSADLPTGETVAVEFLPKEPGEFGFSCPMGMFRGKLVVE
ncbi:MAG: tetratricopeptide repeat protein [Methylocystis sp.]